MALKINGSKLKSSSIKKRILKRVSYFGPLILFEKEVPDSFIFIVFKKPAHHVFI